MLRSIVRSLRGTYAKAVSFGRNEAGSILSILAVLPVLAGTVALGVETGKLYTVKRQMQNAADDAALAGSIDRIAGKTNSVITTDAQYETQRNGFTNGTKGTTVAVNAPPLSGPNVATTGAVEVIVSVPQTFSLGSVLNNWLGRSTAGFTMVSRSVAAQTSYSSTTTNYVGCLVALTTNAEQGVNFTNFNNFNSDCTIISNGSSTSNNSSASVYMASFNNATLNSVWSRGSFYSTGYNHLSLSTSAQTSQTSYAVDPYSGIGATPGTCTYTNYVEPNGSNLTLSPGTYCGGLSVTNKSNIYFQAGTYYIANGDLVIASDNNVSCSNCTGGAGTTFVLTQTTGSNTNIGGVSITSENNITLNAPSSGTYAGLIFYQDRNVPAGTMTSTSKIFTLSSLNNATLYGAIYFPNNAIKISSINNVGGGSSGCTVWIGRYINFASYNNSYIAGCGTYGTKPAGIATTTTSYKGKVME